MSVCEDAQTGKTNGQIIVVEKASESWRNSYEASCVGSDNETHIDKEDVHYVEGQHEPKFASWSEFFYRIEFDRDLHEIQCSYLYR